MNFTNEMNISVSHHHHDDDDGTDDGTGSANIAKATAMVCLFAASMTLGTLPIKLNTWLNWDTDAKNNPVVKFLLGLGGGVLMCTTFLHLLPEVAEGFEDFDIDISVEIPFPELLMCMGFLTMYFVEECVHVYLHRKHKIKDLQSIRRSLSIRRGELEPMEDEKKDLEAAKVSHFHDHSHYQKHNHHEGHSHVVVDYTGHSTVVIIRGFLVVLALSVHELFEGLSVGLETSSGHVWYMFGAVSAHKFVIAFCIGVELVASQLRTLFVVIYIFTFAVVSPLGIGVGMIVTNMEHSSADAVSVVLQGMASGTLLYVVFFEILQGDRKSGLRQFLSVFIGFAIMFGITLLE